MRASALSRSSSPRSLSPRLQARTFQACCVAILFLLASTVQLETLKNPLRWFASDSPSTPTRSLLAVDLASPLKPLSRSWLAFRFPVSTTAPSFDVQRYPGSAEDADLSRPRNPVTSVEEFVNPEQKVSDLGSSVNADRHGRRRKLSLLSKPPPLPLKEDEYTSRKLQLSDLSHTSDGSSSSDNSTSSSSSSSGLDLLTDGSSCRCYRVSNRFCCNQVLCVCCLLCWNGSQLVVVRPATVTPATVAPATVAPATVAPSTITSATITSGQLEPAPVQPGVGSIGGAASVAPSGDISASGNAGTTRRALAAQNFTLPATINGTNVKGTNPNVTKSNSANVKGTSKPRGKSAGKREYATDWFCDQLQPANAAAAQNKTLTDGPLTALPCGIYPFGDDPFEMIVKQSHYKQWGERPMEWLKERVGRAWWRPGSTYLQLLDGSTNNVAHFLGKVMQILLVNGAGERGLKGMGGTGGGGEARESNGELGCRTGGVSGNYVDERISDRSKNGFASGIGLGGDVGVVDSNSNTVKSGDSTDGSNSSSRAARRRLTELKSTPLKFSIPTAPFLPHVDRFLLPRHFYFLRIVQSYGPAGLHASLLHHLLSAALFPDIIQDSRACGPGSEVPGGGPPSASAAGSGMHGAGQAGSEGHDMASGGGEGGGNEVGEGAGGEKGEGGGSESEKSRGAGEEEWGSEERERALLESALNRTLLLDPNTTSLAGGRVEFERVWDKASEERPLCFENAILPGNLAAILYPGGHEAQRAFLEQIDTWMGSEIGRGEGASGTGSRGVERGAGAADLDAQTGPVGSGGLGEPGDFGRKKRLDGLARLDGQDSLNGEKIRLLYLQRTASANQGRRALDHASHVALISLFARLNFDVQAADLGRLSFREQYAAVRRAEVIVAVHGAALAPTCAFLRGVPPVDPAWLGNPDSVQNGSSGSASSSSSSSVSSNSVASSKPGAPSSNPPPVGAAGEKHEGGAVVLEIVPFGTQPTLYQIMSVASGASYIQHQCHAARTLPRDDEFKLFTARDCDRNSSCKYYRVHERPVELSQLDLKEIGHALKLAREIAGKARGGVVEAAEGLRERVKGGLCRYGRKLLLAGFCQQGFVQSPLLGDDNEVCVFHRRCGNGTWPAPEVPLDGR